MIIALLGRRDFPTDGVEDYCRLLSGAFRQRGIEPGLMRVLWDDNGWIRALRDVWRKSADWKGSWVLPQYTALSWSRHGFPVLFLMVLAILRIRRARIVVVFHDVQPYSGTRLVDKMRRLCQCFVMRCAYRWSHASILTIPLEQVSWLPARSSKGTFIPVGANVPATSVADLSARNGHDGKTIVIFAVNDSGDISRELSDITLAAKRASERLHGVRLVTLGRGSLESESKFRQALDGSEVEYRALGVLPAEEVSKVLGNADVSLFVRGPVSTQRGTAIASIACAVPLVAYADSCLPAPLAEAGVVGVRYADAEGLAEATVRVLTYDQLRYELRERSWRAHEKYFSWEAVAARFLEVLHHA